jgi:hypothetical protein
MRSNLIIVLLILSRFVVTQDSYPTLVVDRIKDLQIQDISVYLGQTDNVFEIIQNGNSNAFRTVIYLTNKLIGTSFLNTLPSENFTIYNNCLSYLTKDKLGNNAIALMQDFYIPIEEEEGAVLNPDRRLISIPLLKSDI